MSRKFVPADHNLFVVAAQKGATVWCVNYYEKAEIMSGSHVRSPLGYKI